MTSSTIKYIAFSGSSRIAHGLPAEVATTVKLALEQNSQQTILVFNADTGEQLDLNLHGSLAEVLARYQPLSTEKNEAVVADAENASRRTPGRPRLGVTAREVTLFPRHWQWLAEQPGGASVTLRKLVERELRSNMDKDRARQLCDAGYRFMHVMAGNEPSFEEASRALFAKDGKTFHQLIKHWPADVKKHIKRLTDPLFTQSEDSSSSVENQARDR